MAAFTTEQQKRNRNTLVTAKYEQAYLPFGQSYSTKTYSYVQIRRIFQKPIFHISTNCM